MVKGRPIPAVPHQERASERAARLRRKRKQPTGAEGRGFADIPAAGRLWLRGRCGVANYRSQAGQARSDLRRGHVAEWLRSGLQNRLPRFNSGRGLHSKYQENQQDKRSFADAARANPAAAPSLLLPPVFLSRVSWPRLDWHGEHTAAFSTRRPTCPICAASHSASPGAVRNRRQRGTDTADAMT